MDDFNEARSVLYGALSLLFMYKAAGKKPQDTIKLLGAIEDSDFDGAATASAKTLQEALEQTDGFEKLEEEFDTLFMLPFGDAVPMSASVYYDDLEAGKPLLAVKEVLNLAALRRDDDNFGDNEDNFGFVFALMSRLCALSNDDRAAFITSNKLYDEVIKPFAHKFAERIKQNGNAKLYTSAAVLLERFLIFEAEFYASLAKEKAQTVDRRHPH